LLVSHDREFLNNVVTSTLVLGGDGEVRDYVGGYDDWLRQSASSSPSKPVVTKNAEMKTRIKTEKARKLTFKEERELESLPGRIGKLEEEQEALHQTLADPEFYRSAVDGSEVARLNIRLGELEQELAEVYLRWEELETVKATGG
jgi:ATP-binding cassette subfamily F protein uup